MKNLKNRQEILLDPAAVEAAARVVAARLSGSTAVLIDELRLLVDEYLSGSPREVAAKTVSLLGAFSALSEVAIHGLAWGDARDIAARARLDDDVLQEIADEVVISRELQLAALGFCVETVHALREEAT
jgi:hypothetical protein